MVTLGKFHGAIFTTNDETKHYGVLMDGSEWIDLVTYERYPKNYVKSYKLISSKNVYDTIYAILCSKYVSNRKRRMADTIGIIETAIDLGYIQGKLSDYIKEVDEIEKQEKEIDETLKRIKEKKTCKYITDPNFPSSVCTIPNNYKIENGDIYVYNEELKYIDLEKIVSKYQSKVISRLITEYTKYSIDQCGIRKDNYDETESRMNNYAAGILRAIHIIQDLENSHGSIKIDNYENKLEEGSKVELDSSILKNIDDLDKWIIFKTKDGFYHVGKMTINIFDGEKRYFSMPNLIYGDDKTGYEYTKDQIEYGGCIKLYPWDRDPKYYAQIIDKLNKEKKEGKKS